MKIVCKANIYMAKYNRQLIAGFAYEVPDEDAKAMIDANLAEAA